ncbi:putative zinc finger protein 705G isoform X1 [Macaca nemestrina]|uniref:putative zinc finger protein 705G isoform X1 n=1 Tax=Macaca nemestrina TaxID=9545 RepID=UPI0039B995B7
MQPQESLTFEDIAVDFTQEEGALLNTSQKKLYKDVMLEITSHLVSTGYPLHKLGVIFQPEQGKELWKERTFFQDLRTSGESALESQMTSTHHVSRRGTTVIILMAKLPSFQLPPKPLIWIPPWS